MRWGNQRAVKLAIVLGRELQEGPRAEGRDSETCATSVRQSRVWSGRTRRGPQEQRTEQQVVSVTEGTTANHAIIATVAVFVAQCSESRGLGQGPRADKHTPEARG